MTIRRSLRSGLLAFGIVAGLSIGPLATQTFAHAAACRSDPIVTLSNGTQVTLYEDIYDTASDISSINYQLHIPVGLKVKSVTYQGVLPSSAQTITITADENTGNYDAYTVVNTKTQGISVTAFMSANGTVSTHTSGSSGQVLHSHLHVS